MPTPTSLVDRKVIPRWNHMGSSLTLGFGKPINLVEHFDEYRREDWDIAEKEYNWLNNPSILTALELLAAAYSSNSNRSYKSALKYLQKHKNKLRTPALTFLKRIEHLHHGDLNTLVISQIKEKLSEGHIFNKIHNLKTRLNEFQQNPIVWSNIAHLYGQLGQFEQAEKAIIVASELAPRNRMILRAAAKMYHQIENPSEKALWFLRNSELIDYDPWIIAADIALSDALGLKQKFKQKGAKILKHQQLPDFHISELRSAIGTNEIYMGETRNGKKLLKRSLIDATENSIAQTQWMMKEILHEDIQELNPELIFGSFEARAQEAYSNKQWSHVITNSLNWLYLHPFSESAAMMAGYMLYIENDDVDSAVDITNLGLRANPNCLPLINNIIYYETQRGNLAKADAIMNQIGEGSNTLEKGLYYANRGMISIRKGLLSIGREEYQKARQIFDSEGLMVQSQSAMLHWAIEEMLSEDDPEGARSLAFEALESSDSVDELPMGKLKKRLKKMLSKKERTIVSRIRSLFGARI